jgi:UDP-N-acetylmuramoyl-L-alanyl-D-glutamate--2,6-diaminopimelate ligase
VDYAHSPDGIASLLAAVRPLTKGRIITLFGCGGDRDRGKRPLMGEAAGRGSDFVGLTSDNPRSEDPHAIIGEAEVGLRATGTPYRVCPDRRDAIALALDEARPGDAVIIAGKGHEDYQEIGGVRLPFQDAKVVQELIDEKGRAKSKGKAGAPRDTSDGVKRDPGTARDERRS